MTSARGDGLAADRAAAEATLPEDAVEVGRVLGAWGVKGWIKVQPFSGDPQALFSSKRWYLIASGASLSVPTLLRIIQARDQAGLVVAQARDIDDRNAAQALRGASVLVSRASFPSVSPDEHYWVDLIGLQVINRQSQVLGNVVGLMDTGAHSVLRVRSALVGESSGAAADIERLIPFVAAYVDEVDTAGGRIVVDWGLDY